MRAGIILTGKPIEVDFDETKHVYATPEGVRVPSVSELLRPLTASVYSEVDPEVLRRAAEFGTAVHACTEFLDAGDLDEDSIDPAWASSLDAYKAFLRDCAPEWSGVELRLACERYAGTLDRVGTMKGETWIVDLKTTSTIHDHVGVQLAAYEALYRAHHPGFPETAEIKLAALQLRKDGTYRLVQFGSAADRACVNALITLRNWKLNHDYS